MHTLFNADMRWELVERNPIVLVRQSRKRMKASRALSPNDFKAFLAELRKLYRTMVLVSVCMGLRVSELLALQWQDINFEDLTLHVRRSVVEGVVNPTKMDSSEAILPIAPELAEPLLNHRSESIFIGDQDFVFAGATGKPRWAGIVLTDHLGPAAERSKIAKIGWHPFRPTYSTRLHALGATPAVQRELLRHADIQTTMNIYTQASIEDKRDAADKIGANVWKM